MSAKFLALNFRQKCEPKNAREKVAVPRTQRVQALILSGGSWSHVWPNQHGNILARRTTSNAAIYALLDGGTGRILWRWETTLMNPGLFRPLRSATDLQGVEGFLYLGNDLHLFYRDQPEPERIPFGRPIQRAFPLRNGCVALCCSANDLLNGKGYEIFLCRPTGPSQRTPSGGSLSKTPSGGSLQETPSGGPLERNALPTQKKPPVLCWKSSETEQYYHSVVCECKPQVLLLFIQSLQENVSQYAELDLNASVDVLSSETSSTAPRPVLKICAIERSSHRDPPEGFQFVHMDYGRALWRCPNTGAYLVLDKAAPWGIFSVQALFSKSCDPRIFNPAAGAHESRASRPGLTMGPENDGSGLYFYDACSGRNETVEILTPEGLVYNCPIHAGPNQIVFREPQGVHYAVVRVFDRASSLIHACCVEVAKGQWNPSKETRLRPPSLRDVLPADLAETCALLFERRCLVVACG